MNKKFKNILLIVFIIILFIGIGFTNGNNRKVTLIESIFSSVIMLPQKGYVYAKSWLTKDARFFPAVDELKAENQKLKEENDELNAKLMNYELILSENTILKEHVNLINSYPDYNVIAADIISESTSNWEKVYTINRGSKDGVKPDMTVVAEDGLVGYVASVTTSTSKIISILDPGNTISARTTRTRDSITCKGNSLLMNENKLKLNKIPTDLVLIEGDKIETSGLGGRYPKGIPIGEVKEFNVKKNPVENEAVVKTYVDFNKLETVAIICEEFKSGE
ncbi:MAG: rod shape-determining protein MreC [Clostridia bacterium]|nr:rod shape-determining protein MreC [Clostridia bacterium]